VGQVGNLPHQFSSRIVFFGRTVDALEKTIPTGGGEASLTVIASGLDRDQADCNSARVVINGSAVEARYAGPIGNNFEGALRAEFGDHLDHLTQIEIGVPPGVQSGVARVYLQIGAFASDPVEIEFAPARPIPKIGAVMNAADDGADIHARGAKSRLKILVEGFDETAGVENVRVRIGERIVEPDRVSFHPGNAIYEVDARLPDDITPGSMELKINFGDLQSAGAIIQIED